MISSSSAAWCMGHTKSYKSTAAKASYNKKSYQQVSEAKCSIELTCTNTIACSGLTSVFVVAMYFIAAVRARSFARTLGNCWRQMVSCSRFNFAMDFSLNEAVSNISAASKRTAAPDRKTVTEGGASSLENRSSCKSAKDTLTSLQKDMLSSHPRTGKDGRALCL